MRRGFSDGQTWYPMFCRSYKREPKTNGLQAYDKMRFCFGQDEADGDIERLETICELLTDDHAVHSIEHLTKECFRILFERAYPSEDLPATSSRQNCGLATMTDI